MPLCSRNEIYKQTHFHTLLFIFWWTVSPLLISWSLFCSCFQSAIIMIPHFFPLYSISVNWITHSGFSSTQTSLIWSSPSLNANQPNKEETSSSHIILQLLLFPPLCSQTSPKLLSLFISLAVFIPLPLHSGFLAKDPVSSTKIFDLIIQRQSHFTFWNSLFPVLTC